VQQHQESKAAGSSKQPGTPRVAANAVEMHVLDTSHSL
jgi:hypothetical protein